VRCALTSVSAVASADIRQNFSTQPSNTGDDPFSLLLDAVTDVNVAAPQEAPQQAERRDDVPAPQAKPETDSRETKRRAKDTEPADKPKMESAAAPKEAASDDEADETEETDASEGDEMPVDALLALALGKGQQQTQGEVQAAVTAGEAETAAPATQIAANAEIEIAAAPVAAAAANTSEMAEAQATAQVAAGVKANAKAEIPTAPLIQADAEAEVAIPNISADNFAKLLKPLKALPAAIEAQADAKPLTIEAAASIPGRALANLEMLNAALSKHFQLSAVAEADAPAPEAQKPVFPGNGVLPNLALSLQSATTVNAHTQAAVETARAVPLESLAVEIATRAKNGERRFDIRLDPPELGRIDVRLEIDHKGNTSTKLIVERAETLDMLQRDARGLEKALQSAGLKTDAGGLEFTLRQDAQTQQNQPQGPDMRHRPDHVQIEEEVSAQVALGNATLAAQLRGGVDIRI
jgi:flagellar hook-length control protein FliK